MDNKMALSWGHWSIALARKDPYKTLQKGIDYYGKGALKTRHAEVDTLEPVALIPVIGALDD